MLGDLWRAIVEFIGYLWPLHIVWRWERGIYLVLGEPVVAWRAVGIRVGADRLELKQHSPKVLPAGVYLKIPFFTDVHPVSVAWDFAETDQIDVTLQDGRSLSCVGVAQVRVTDPLVAYLEFHDYEVDRKRMLTAAISELLQEAEPERFNPERRGIFLVYFLGLSL